MRAASSEGPAVTAATMLVAAFGHAWLRDQAFGIKVVERLRAERLPPGVVLADWSFGTITAFQKLSERRYRRAILVSATPRGRTPGALYRFRPGAPPSADEVQARIADSAMGMVSVDNLLVMGRFYRRLPDDVVLIEAEPVDESWGAELSPELAGLLPAAVALVRSELGR